MHAVSRIVAGAAATRAGRPSLRGVPAGLFGGPQTQSVPDSGA
jgi:hypothetical protein